MVKNIKNDIFRLPEINYWMFDKDMSDGTKIFLSDIIEAGRTMAIQASVQPKSCVTPA